MVENDKYGGKYIATKSFNDDTVVAFGCDPAKVVEDARRLCRSPVIMFIHKKGTVCIY